jgi:hypothetical protein
MTADTVTRAPSTTRAAQRSSSWRRWIAGDVDDVHLPVLPLGVLERHRDGELTLVLVIGRVRDGRPRLDRPKVFFPVWKRSASTSDVFPVPR